MEKRRITENLKTKFSQLFGGEPDAMFFSPGRVNLIGEHTDYNGGYVFPCALSLGTYGAARKRDDNVLRLATVRTPGFVETSLAKLEKQTAADWANYPIGVADQLIKAGYEPGGIDLVVDGNIPGGGLSSSASLELLTGVVFDELYSLGIGRVELVKFCQKAENQFVGVNCGIMDQFAVGMGKKGHAMFLDCASLEFEYVPVALDGCTLVVMNTNKDRELAGSKYNERRGECERAVEMLRKKLDISLLGDISAPEFEVNKGLITDGTVRKRAEHVVYEIERTQDAVKCLKTGDIRTFGRLMDESHVSLRDLYEVTGPELDAIVEEAWNTTGTVGARMTGAGFGGCAVAIVESGAYDGFVERVGKGYRERTGRKAEFYPVEIGEGAGKIS
ncbi:MAG: galactokinase [Defluviitaleaceae bacterium]|nr:galactokinase [Defluviitaleaceae bacterium]